MKTVLFACVQNAGRSQMAAALFNALADPGMARAISAGTRPAARVHDEVVASLREIGIDVSEVVPRRLTEDLARSADLLVTMGCGEECPVVPGVPREDWPLDDPAGQPPDRVRAIREEIRARVVALVYREGWASAWCARDGMPNDIEQILGGVLRSVPAARLEQLKVCHPGADDDGLWFLTVPGFHGEAQIESSTRQCPVLIETDRSEVSGEGASVDEAIEMLVAELRAMSTLAMGPGGWLHDHPFLGLEFDWLATDRSGFVAMVSTAGAGPIPRSSLSDVGGVDAAMASLRAMDEMGGALHDGTEHGNREDWIAMARRGIYAFDWDRPSRTYRRIAAPVLPRTLASLPESVAAVVRRTHLDLRLAQTVSFPADQALLREDAP